MFEIAFFPITDGLRASAARTPEAPALLGEQPLAYRALHAFAGRIAARVQASGVAPGARMAIWTPKGADCIAAIWGALESGLAYAPLDPTQPTERAARILAEAQPEVLVAQPDLLAHLPGPLPDSVRLALFSDCEAAHPAPGLPIATDWLRGLPDAAHLPFQPTPDAVAAVLFTSGSTGVPKGVQLSYRNLATFIGWAVAEFDLRADDVIANHASFHFDLSTFDLFASAKVGAAVWPIPTPQQSNIAAISEGLRRHCVTTLYAVPSILMMLTRAGALGAGDGFSLRRVLFAGEVFPIVNLRAMARQAPEGCSLYNLYGPTETNVCTFHKVRDCDLAADHAAPIGRPLPGQRALVLDPETREPAAEGAKGELVIEGSLVTPGYLGSADPESAANHKAKRHATGDIVSWRDGALIYHGRIDRIVKVQGNRVELGEVEAALSRHPMVRQAAVVQVKGPRSNDLVAFVSCDAEHGAPNTIDLLKHMSHHVPRYMLPRHVRFLPMLPRTSNGKTDLRQLQRAADDQFLRPALVEP
jgi:amino acid adenylation domain-containing protein